MSRSYTSMFVLKSEIFFFFLGGGGGVGKGLFFYGIYCLLFFLNCYLIIIILISFDISYHTDFELVSLGTMVYLCT